MPYSTIPARVNHICKIYRFLAAEVLSLDLNKILSPHRKSYKRTIPRQTRIGDYFCLLFLFIVSFTPTLARNADSHNFPPPDYVNSEQTGIAQSGNQPIRIKAEQNPANLFVSELDYQAGDSSFKFMRFFNSANQGIDVGLGPGWQSNYHRQILVKTAHTVIVLDANGKQLSFQFILERSRWESLNRGHIVNSGKNLDWLDTDGTTYTFKGPYLVSVTKPSGQNANLYYHDGRLVKHVDVKNGVMTFHYSKQKNGFPPYSHTSRAEAIKQIPGDDTANSYNRSNPLLKTVHFPDGTQLTLNYSGSALVNSKVTVDKENTPESRVRETSYLYHENKSGYFQLPAELVSNWKIQHTDETENIDCGGSYAELKARFLYDTSGSLTTLSALYQEKIKGLSHENPALEITKSPVLDDVLNPPGNLQNPNCSDNRQELQVYLPENEYKFQTSDYSSEWYTGVDGYPASISIDYHKPSVTEANEAESAGVGGGKHLLLSTITAELHERDSQGIPRLINETNGHYYRLYTVNEFSDDYHFGTGKTGLISVESRPQSHSDIDPLQSTEPVKSSETLITDIVHQNINRISIINSSQPGSGKSHSISKRQERIELPRSKLADILSIDQMAKQYATFVCEISSPEFPLTPPDLQASQPETDEAHECENETNPTSEPTASLSSYPGAIQLEIRPQNCSSYFDVAHAITRGSNIETAIANSEEYETALSTVRWFPAIDFVVDRTAIAQISRDLQASSYNGDDLALFERIMREANLIFERFIQPLAQSGEVIAADNNQTTRITQSDIDAVRFELVVQRASMTPHQQSQIQRAAQEMKTLYSIEFKVVEIP